MTGPEHYREAERLIEPGEHDEGEPELVARDIALAQVHATLALAAATALLSGTGGVIPLAEYDAWAGVAGEPETAAGEDTLGIYLITRDEEKAGYDEAYGFVIAAIDEESARMMIADGEHYGDEGAAPWLDSQHSAAVMAGRTLPDAKPHIILRRFQAG